MSPRECTRLRSPGQAVAGGSPGPSVFQLVADCSWWVMVASVAAFWSSAAVTCHTGISELGEPFLCTPPQLAPELLPWRSSHQRPPLGFVGCRGAAPICSLAWCSCPGSVSQEHEEPRVGSSGVVPGEGMGGSGGLCPTLWPCPSQGEPAGSRGLAGSLDSLPE